MLAAILSLMSWRLLETSDKYQIIQLTFGWQVDVNQMAFG
jgi:hypothetical protein